MRSAICFAFLLSIHLSNQLVAQKQPTIDRQAQEQPERIVGFHGSRNANGDTSKVPTEWSDKKNLIWKLRLPGAGASSPIVIGNKIFVTCYGGYGLDRKKPGKLERLVRNLVCADLETGKQLWKAKIPLGEREDRMTHQISDHGYASSTPVSDGKHVFAFFGKAGIAAFDLDGNKIWHVQVGEKSSKFQQGSGSSPILFGNLVIVNAADEDRAIIALDKTTGKEVWRAASEKLDGSYVTPALVKTSDGSTELVVSMIGEAWGLNPNSGKQLWKLMTSQDGSVVPTPVIHGMNVYLFGGMGGTTYSLKPGRRGILTNRDAIWTSRNGSIVSTPLLHDGHLYWANMQGIAFCIKSEDGSLVYKERLGKKAGCYASPVLANGKIYYLTRTGGAYVVPAKPKFSVIAHNTLASDETRFDGTPFVHANRIYLRSNKALYCLGEN